MRILCVSQTYLPSHRASSVQTLEMCSAFAGLGHSVSLLTKSRRALSENECREILAGYSLEHEVLLAVIPRASGRGGSIPHALELRRWIKERHADFDLAYCRDLVGAAVATRSGLPTVFEVHEPPAGAVQKFLFRRSVASGNLVRVVSVTRAGTAALTREFPQLDARSAPNGARAVDESFASALDTARPLRVGFVGNLHPGKGAELLPSLARLLPECHFALAGGSEQDLRNLTGGDPEPNITCHGFVERGDIQAFIAHLDVALLPNQAVTLGASGRRNLAPWTSPLKLFEYMAAGKAVVASDLPALREILTHEVNALLVDGADLGSWRRAIARLAGDSDLRRRLGSRARRDQLASYTWEGRARSVLAGLDPAQRRGEASASS